MCIPAYNGAGVSASGSGGCLPLGGACPWADTAPPGKHPLDLEADTPHSQTPPLDRHPSDNPPEMTTEAGGIHPTAMHSCFHLIFLAVLGEIGQVIGPPSSSPLQV